MCVDDVRIIARGVIHDRWIILFYNGRELAIEVVDPQLPDREHKTVVGKLLAPMPGKVVRVCVAKGDPVKKGKVLIVVEAMKMEHSLLAFGDGSLKLVNCLAGQQVAEGEELIILEEGL
jgi:3-methylcrotonyl-CoA carboxylase alpha subunit